MQDPVDNDQPGLAPHEPFNSVVELSHLCLAAPRADRLGHTVLGVVGEQLEGDALECCPRRVDLGQDVDAIPILLNHLLDASHLTLDAPESRFDLLLVLGVTWHAWIIPTRGMCPGSIQSEDRSE